MEKTVILVSSDGEWFEIAESVAAQSTVIGNVIEDVGGRSPIPLFNVPARVLAKVIEYLKNHGGGDELVSGVPVKVLLEYLKAANYLDIKGLIDLVSQKIADSVEACKPEAEMANDFSPEEGKYGKRSRVDLGFKFSKKT